jgi:hypothetical protein
MNHILPSEDGITDGAPDLGIPWRAMAAGRGIPVLSTRHFEVVRSCIGQESQ